MDIVVLESCLIMVTQSVKDTVPATIFETDNAMTLSSELSLDLYKVAMKTGLPIKNYKVGNNSASVEFFETTTNEEAGVFLKQCDIMILRRLQGAMPSTGTNGLVKGIIAPEADIIVDRIEQTLNVRRILRNFAVLNNKDGKTRSRLLLHHAL